MILFRCDASLANGFSRLQRSLYLASQLRHRDQVLFIAGDDKAVQKLLAEKNIPAVSPREVAAGLPELAKTVVFDLDVFGPADRRLLEQAKTDNVASLQICDGGEEHQPADWIIAIAPGPISSKKNALAGLEYAPLHHQFRHFHPLQRKYRPRCRRLLLGLGSGVEYRQLRLFVDGLSRQRLQLKVSGGTWLKKADKRNLQRIYPGIHFVGKSQSLARPLFEADAALLASAATALEAAACGTPACYLYRDERRRDFFAALAEKGAGMLLGKIEDFDAARLAATLQSLNADKRQAMGQAGKELVDGLGMHRLLKFLEENKLIAPPPDSKANQPAE